MPPKRPTTETRQRIVGLKELTELVQQSVELEADVKIDDRQARRLAAALIHDGPALLTLSPQARKARKDKIVGAEIALRALVRCLDQPTVQDQLVRERIQELLKEFPSLKMRRAWEIRNAAGQQVGLAERGGDPLLELYRVMVESLRHDGLVANKAFIVAQAALLLVYPQEWAPGTLDRHFRTSRKGLHKTAETEIHQLLDWYADLYEGNGASLTLPAPRR